METVAEVNTNTKTQKKRHDFRKLLVAFFCLIAILQSGLRDINNLPSVNDTPNYAYIYQSVANTSWTNLIDGFTFEGQDYEDRDPGYSLFIKVTQLIYTDFTFFMFLTAIIFMIPFGMYVYRCVKSYEGIILVFLLFFALFTGIINSFMRQAVALGLVLFSIRFIDTKEWKKYILFTAVAFFIHNSSLVAAPLFLLACLKKPKRGLAVALVASPFLIYFSNSLFSHVITGTVYEVYMNDNFENPVNYILLVYIIAIAAFVFYKNIILVDYYKTLTAGVIGSLIILPIVFMGNTMLRISYYYVLLIIPLVPIIIDQLKISPSIRKSIYFVLIPLLLIYIFS